MLVYGILVKARLGGVTIGLTTSLKSESSGSVWIYGTSPNWNQFLEPVNYGLHLPDLFRFSLFPPINDAGGAG